MAKKNQFILINKLYIKKCMFISFKYLKIPSYKKSIFISIWTVKYYFIIYLKYVLFRLMNIQYYSIDYTY